MAMLSELYESVKADGNAVFWWVGAENNWCNVYCAFENGRMVAKGQVEIMNTVPPDRPSDSKHAIYLNLKTVPERANDSLLLEAVYHHLYLRALELKRALPSEYGTNLCVGNAASETANNHFFVQKGYRHLNSLFSMKRDLNEPIADLALHESFRFSHWMMDTPEEEREYLELDAEIWTSAPIGIEKLARHKNQPLWKSMIVRQGETIIAGLMAWEEDGEGEIEDVFVREPWRNRGCAKYLLTQALHDLKSHGLPSANLMVLTANHAALSLYEGVGFGVVSEEIRYYIELE
ncbi:GNAT family N-acetyltransferase [Paenibacillus sp. MMS18-CY102]|uniref:GNAT family N-acetyltransferase n=1 Tax=Paenibacillus sp. MMS18-CY102 TaxID=2682849 RepID=UPI001365A38E|nr:GNAT family N-acetyltransferase [Paenibacillus sp. MMS18-CY102]MWC31221.1 GNAT family N-acetyltransferase [Paenibacillus sp. MMS18-CY102]